MIFYIIYYINHDNHRRYMKFANINLDDEAFHQRANEFFKKYDERNEALLDFFESNEFEFYFEKIIKYVDAYNFLRDEDVLYSDEYPVTYEQLNKVCSSIEKSVDTISNDEYADSEWHYRGYRMILVCGQGCYSTITKLCQHETVTRSDECDECLDCGVTNFK